MRGIHRHIDNAPITVRFIPADAGNTGAAASPVIRLPVHPRGCGEYDNTPPEQLERFGSSPRMRGILQRHAIHRAAHRFIPADAGNTRSPPRRPCPATVHPRGCGEYMTGPIGSRCSYGSSPRMRGIRRRIGNCVRFCRFIPADAGNTQKCRDCARKYPVHPRGCGEYLSIFSQS